MAEGTVSGIRDYRQLSERIATAGQPTQEELAAIARAGYEVVINLDVSARAQRPTSYALEDEGGLVRSLGLEYVHIPVVWEQPTKADLARFFEIMQARQDKTLFVHCAANRRVSVFMALYRILRLGWAVHEAYGWTFLDTMPPVWRTFFEDMLKEDWG
jgi:uncharacterized protein (TIGR01244 family)